MRNAYTYAEDVACLDAGDHLLFLWTPNVGLLFLYLIAQDLISRPKIYI